MSAAPIHIDVVFDATAGSPYREATLAAVSAAGARLGLNVAVEVVPTATIDKAYLTDLPDGIVIGPGTPDDAPSAPDAGSNMFW